MTLVIALLLFASVSTFMGLTLSMAAGHLTVWISWLSLAAGLIGAGAAWQTCRGIFTEKIKPSRFEWVILIAFLLFALRQFLWIYYYQNNDIYTLNRYPFFDLHAHLAYITNFVNGASFWPDYPFFAGPKLHYHFGIDLLTALFVKVGVPLTHALPLIGLAGAVLTLIALFRWGRGFTVASFLFSGGFAGYLFLLTGEFKDYQADIAWKSIPLTILVPQRGFLYAFPAGLLLLWSWRQKFLKNQKGLPSLVEGILWGVMPIFQIQTFLFLSLVFLIWTVATNKVKQSLPTYYTALLPATFLVLKLTDNFQLSSSMIWFKPGWQIENQNPLWFLLYNFGFYFPLVIWSVVEACRSRQKAAMLMALPAGTFLIVLFFVMFSPWDWDNIKFMIWCYLLLLPVMDELIIKQLKTVWRYLLLSTLFLSGFVCIVSAVDGNNRGLPIIGRDELDEVCYTLNKIGGNLRLATTREAYHPVLLCGHRVACGYNTPTQFGINLGPMPAEQKLDRLMRGEFDWRDMAAQLKARYLFWGKREAEVYKDSNRPWEIDCLKIAENPWCKIYDLQTPSLFTKPVPVQTLKEDMGIAACYFNNPAFEGTPLKQEIVPAVDFSWNEQTRLLPAPFAAVFEGEIFIPEKGDVTFILASDDASELQINGENLIENGGVHSLRVKSATKSMESGWYPIRIRYQDVGGAAELRFLWTLPGHETEKVTAANLRPLRPGKNG